MVHDTIQLIDDTLVISEIFGLFFFGNKNKINVYLFRSDPFGVALINFEDSIIQLAPGSPGSIVDRSIVVHRDPDDFGRGMFTDSLTTGYFDVNNRFVLPFLQTLVHV